MPLTLLVCAPGDGCEEERAWLAGVQSGLIVVVGPNDPPDGFLPADGGAAFAQAVESADYAVQDRKWGVALRHLDAADAALAAWPGLVENHVLVRAQVLRGVALRHRSREGTEAVPFRQASALAWKGEPDARGLEEADRAALDDERRKLLSTGNGTLSLSAGPQWTVDGIPVDRGTLELPLGLHRLTAVEAGRLRTFVAAVPVLPGRTVTVAPAWGPADDAAWLMRELQRGVQTLDSDPAAAALLADWCARNEVDVVGVAEVVASGVSVPAATVDLSPADPRRPAAAAGEVLPVPDGAPGTFEEEVAAGAQAAAERRPSTPGWRVRMAWFDASTRRWSSEPSVIRITETQDDRRFRLAARIGWLHLAEREHGALDLSGAWSVAGPWSVRGEVGLALADGPYNFYADWVDNKLIHVAAAVGWSPPGTVAPLLAAGAEFHAPLSVGAFVDAGVAATFDRVWAAELLARGGAGQVGPSWGVGVGLGRRW